MKDTPTPRTDAVRFRVGESDHWAVHEVYAKQLERELAEAQDTIARSLKSLPVGYLPNHTPESLPSRIDHVVKELAEMEEQCESWANQSMSWKLKADVLGRQLAESEKERRVLSHAAKHLNDRMAELQRERDNAESDMKQADLGTLRALHQRNEARDERDGHAEAMNDIADVFDMPTGASSSDIVKKVREAQEQLDSWQRLALSSEILRKKAEEQRDRLAEAARVVVDRWETPVLKHTLHNCKFIRALADALDAIEGGQP